MAMDCRNFEITLISANDLEDVRKLFKLKVYGRVSLGSNNNNVDTEKRTPPDKHGEINPAWNWTLKYTIAESAVQHYNTILVIKLYCKRKLGDRYIGEVHAPIQQLFDYAVPLGGSVLVNYPVQRGSVNSQGVLKFSYRFGHKVTIDKLLLAESILHADWSTCIL